MLISNSNTMTLEVEDFTGQVRRRAGDIPRTATVNDLVESIQGEMQLPHQDAQCRPIQYGALTSRGEMLNATARLGDVLEDQDVVTLTKSVTAGGQAFHLFDENVTDDFSQLGGLDKEISLLKRHIDFRLRHPLLAGKDVLKNKCGILLKGVPDSGKTKIARCCAGYVRRSFPDRPCRFMHVVGRDYNRSIGETEHRIVERFNAVREAADDGPVVMFWDQVDTIARRRGMDFGSGAPDRILNTFLSQIDGVLPLANVILLFATNRVETLDPALLHPGRIDEKIGIPTPNRRAAEAILRRYLDRGLPLAGKYDNTAALVASLLWRLFTPHGDYAEVARVTLRDGRRFPVAGPQLLSGAMLENVVHVAAHQAAVREAKTGQIGVTEEDLALALERELISAVSLLTPGNVKRYVPQDAQPVAVDALLSSRR